MCIFRQFPTAPFCNTFAYVTSACWEFVENLVQTYACCLLLLLSYVVIVVKLCCVEGLMEDRCISNTHSR